MGFAKRELERQQECSSAATTIAMRVGLLQRCEFCEEVKDPLSNNFEDAYRLGNSLVTDGDDLVAPFASRHEMTDTIKEVVEETADSCHCDHQFARDD